MRTTWSIQAFSAEGIEKLYIGDVRITMSAARNSAMRASDSAVAWRSASVISPGGV
jgi:hypothetical protein